MRSKLFALAFTFILLGGGYALAQFIWVNGTQQLGPPPSSFSPTLHGPSVTLSNNNLTATVNSPTAENIAITTISHNASIRTFEVTIGDATNCISGPHFCGVGLATPSASLTPGQYLGVDNNSVAFYSLGNMYMNGGGACTVGSTGVTFGTGDVLEIEVNFTAKTLSIAKGKNGTLNGPYDISCLSSMTLSPAVDLVSNGNNMTFNGSTPSNYPGAVPWDGAIPLNITSVTLNQTGCTSGTANSPVGTVAVVMSDGSNFSGTLTTSPANGGTGGFHLSGATLQTAGGAGTAAGTYTDMTIVATQSTAGNSPQSITPNPSITCSPVHPVSLVFNPASPSISDTSSSGTFVSGMTVTMSDGSTYTGTPVINSCTMTGGASCINTFKISAACPSCNVVTNQAPPLTDSVDTLTISAN